MFSQLARPLMNLEDTDLKQLLEDIRALDSEVDDDFILLIEEEIKFREVKNELKSELRK
ncbi:hypothetical protein [Ferviditalea candida]|uniref:Uncharacterized protein n=1 Tax=Ferviditalea candida TaxID=3108399 RepID=A0ABU5ZFE9_9BACL|nr:hypothetical protein [Paenibacillaceae bacterium T2]